MSRNRTQVKWNYTNIVTRKDLAEIIISKTYFHDFLQFTVLSFCIHNRVCMQTVPGESEGTLGYPR